VIQEVATKLTTTEGTRRLEAQVARLKELGALEAQVARSSVDAKNILQEVEEIGESVENEVETLHQEMGREREKLAGLFLSPYSIKEQIITELQTKSNNSIQKLEQWS
jgi:hypothetical protein